MQQPCQNGQQKGINLYQIPSCTICLSQLSEDITNLSCGHTFHASCITQHFQYRSTCPNCQKRAHSKQIRLVLYSVVKNSQSASMMRQVLQGLSSSEKTQTELLLKEFQTSVDKNQKYQNQIQEFEKQVKQLQQELSKSKTEHNRGKVQNETYRKEILDLKKVIQAQYIDIGKYRDDDLAIRMQNQRLRQMESEYEKMRKLKHIMSQNSEPIVKYKTDLESRGTPSEQMARLFFDMIMIKNLDVIKLKEKLSKYPQKISEQQHQIRRLKNLLQRANNQNQSINQKRSIDKTKYDELKIKFKVLYDKYRNKLQQINLMNRSQGVGWTVDDQDSFFSKISFPLAQSGAGISAGCAKNNGGNVSFASNFLNTSNLTKNNISKPQAQPQQRPSKQINSAFESSSFLVSEQQSQERLQQQQLRNNRHYFKKPQQSSMLEEQLQPQPQKLSMIQKQQQSQPTRPTLQQTKLSFINNSNDANDDDGKNNSNTISNSKQMFKKKTSIIKSLTSMPAMLSQHQPSSLPSFKGTATSTFGSFGGIKKRADDKKPEKMKSLF